MATILTFDGETFDEARDGERLTNLINRVWAAMLDGNWHTLPELAKRCGGTEASISARIRDFRKERFGGHTVEREFVHRGHFRYRLVRPVPRDGRQIDLNFPPQFGESTHVHP